jgi:hypothetical protein
MLRSRLWMVTGLYATGSLWLGGCSGKVERGGGGPSGDGAPVQQPAAGPANPESTRAEPARHWLIVVELEPAAHVARTLTSRAVELPLPRRRGPERQGPWRVDVLDAEGARLFSAPLEDAAAVRGEFADAHGQLNGVTAQKRVAAVTLRLPWLHGASEVRIVSVSEGGERELGRVAYPQAAP